MKDALRARLKKQAQTKWKGPCGEVVVRFRTLTRVERGRIRLEGLPDGREVGPIAVPEAISRCCRVGWTISGVVGRLGRTWRLVEASNVYPGER